MKKLTATLLASSLLGLAAYAQGTVNFANIQGSLNVPVYMSDGTTKVAAGNTFMAELLAGTTQGNLNISVATSGFLAAGYFSAGAKTVTGIAGGATAWMQVRFWNTANGSSYAAAAASGANNAYGSSNPFQVTLGDPTASPPGVPAALSGLAGQTLKLNSAVPEPSSLALAGLGAAALLVFRRRK
jgi:hypothetical protein